MEQIPKMIINLYRNEEYYRKADCEQSAKRSVDTFNANNQGKDGVKSCKQKNLKQGENSIKDSQVKSISAANATR